MIVSQVTLPNIYIISAISLVPRQQIKIANGYTLRLANTALFLLLLTKKSTQLFNTKQNKREDMYKSMSNIQWEALLSTTKTSRTYKTNLHT